MVALGGSIGYTFVVGQLPISTRIRSIANSTAKSHGGYGRLFCRGASAYARHRQPTAAGKQSRPNFRLRLPPAARSRLTGLRCHAHNPDVRASGTYRPQVGQLSAQAGKRTCRHRDIMFGEQRFMLLLIAPAALLLLLFRWCRSPSAPTPVFATGRFIIEENLGRSRPLLCRDIRSGVPLRRAAEHVSVHDPERCRSAGCRAGTGAAAQPSSPDQLVQTVLLVR